MQGYEASMMHQITLWIWACKALISMNKVFRCKFWISILILISILQDQKYQKMNPYNTPATSGVNRARLIDLSIQMLNPCKISCRVYFQNSRNWLELRMIKFTKTNTNNKTHKWILLWWWLKSKSGHINTISCKNRILQPDNFRVASVIHVHELSWCSSVQPL